MAGGRGEAHTHIREDLPLYEGEVPKDQEITRINKNDLEKVERYIAFHPHDFDHDFRDENVSVDEKKVREIKIIQAVCEILYLSPEDPLVPKYVEAILKQLKKGIIFEDDKAIRSSRGFSGKIVSGAAANGLRTSKRTD